MNLDSDKVIIILYIGIQKFFKFNMMLGSITFTVSISDTISENEIKLECVEKFCLYH